MHVHFKRDLLENQNFNIFNILLYIAILCLTSIPVIFWKIAPINRAMVIFTNILEMHCLNRDGTNEDTYQYQYLGYKSDCADCSVYANRATSLMCWLFRVCYM